MGAVAGLLAAAGHEVRGSDTAVYPPMSEQLAALGIPVYEGFAASNLDWTPDLVVVGNVNSKDHVEVVEAQARSIALTSFPALIGERFLADRHSIVVAGTHGKTTTTSLIAHILFEAGRDPSYFVGGVPVAAGQGWRLGLGDDFVVEGDEYDTAFFDKGSKFLHYRPRSAIITSVELDHVDIFESLEAVRETFRRFVGLIPPADEGGRLVVSNESSDALLISQNARCLVERYAVVDAGAEPPADVAWTASNLEYLKSGRVAFEVHRHHYPDPESPGRQAERIERFETILVGRHNVSNCLAAIAICLGRGVPVEQIRRGVSSFAGVRRRQELRGIAGGVTVIDDYAHHPTAVRETLRGLRKRFPKRRLIAVYEPRSATSRRRTFQDEFVSAFAHADEVIVGKLYDPSKIPADQRFDPERLALDLHRGGTKSSYVPDVDRIVEHLAHSTAAGDVVVVLSSGSFEGLHDRLLDAIGDPVVPARRTDMAGVRDLLQRAHLAASDVPDTAFPSFFVVRSEGQVVACVSLEVYGEEAILRSLAVDPEQRGNGFGWMMADTAIEHARWRGVRRIYLLTETASDFFAAKHGFRVVDRSTVSPAVASSPTFRSSTDSKFVAMRLDM
jgi:UDP-N-acetylmuramate: L-alanyl-gamma-D-glutamyl-meso-diaminopimelate ligase